MPPLFLSACLIYLLRKMYSPSTTEMHRQISKLVHEHFYEIKVESGCIINSHTTTKQLGHCSFLDIMYEDRIRAKGRACVENAAVIILLKKLCTGIYVCSLSCVF